jgi:hypothetical protein
VATLKAKSSVVFGKIRCEFKNLFTFHY